MASPNMSLKLLVDKKDQRVLFTEAPKEFVDFLFHIFSLPLGTLIKFLGSNQMVGCLGKLKDSIESLPETYLKPGFKMDDVFNPKTAFNSDTFLLSYDAASIDESAASNIVYRCGNASRYCSYCHNSCRSNATLYGNSKCPGCKNYMNLKMNLVTPKEVATAEEATTVKKTMKEGYVKEVVTYMVMDDLVVTPMSTISSITVINRFGVTDLSQLEERTVSFGKDEGLKLLKASLMTDKVLTAIFMD